MTLRLIKYNCRPWLLLTALLFTQIATAQTPEERVLFIGNSFTFYWNVPRMVEEMAAHHKLQWDVDQVTLGGATLAQHWKGERGLNTRVVLRDKAYDRIILQDHSTYPILKPEVTREYVKNFITSIKTHPTKWYFFSTWIYPYLKDKANGPNPIDDFYRTLEKETGQTVLEVGKVFAAFAKAHPNIRLLTDDDKHTSPQGSYLIACTIITQLTGENPVGLPHRFFSRDTEKQQDIYYNIVQRPTAKIMQNFLKAYFNL